VRTRTFLGFAFPSILAMVGLMAVPLGLTVWLGFHRITFRGEYRWAGLDNYEATLSDPDFLRSLEFTLLFCAITIPAKIALGFVSALALERVNAFWRAVFLACLLLPFIVTPVVGTLAFSWLFRDFGIVTWWLREAGIVVHWLGSDLASRALVMIHYVWHGTPFATIVLFAGLQAIPRDEIEATVVDGARFRDQLAAVILPHLKTLFVFLALMMVMDAYRVFDSIYMLTRGVNGTESVMMYNYRVAIVENAVARGSAVSVLTVFGILVLLIPFLISTWREQRAIR
jgi:multiple sugar transport system permease protein